MTHYKLGPVPLDWANAHRKRLSKKSLKRISKQFTAILYVGAIPRCNARPDYSVTRGKHLRCVDKGHCSFSVNAIARVVTRREQRKNIRWHCWYWRGRGANCGSRYRRKPWA